MSDLALIDTFLNTLKPTVQLGARRSAYSSDRKSGVQPSPQGAIKALKVAPSLRVRKVKDRVHQ